MSGLLGKTNIAAVGSGSDLNFSVVGSTSQPQGKEHLVWVKTDVPIPSWVVSPNKPQNPAEGMVWIHDGSNNGINILRKNAVEIFPDKCWQYVNGVWAMQSAYIYLVSVGWRELFDGIIYRNGTEFLPLASRGLLGTINSHATAPNVTKHSDSIKITIPYYNTGNGGVLEIAQDIDVTEFDTVSMNVTEYTQGGAANRCAMIVFNREVENIWDDYSDWANVIAYAQITKNGQYSVNLSSISGKVDIGLWIYNAAATSTNSVTFNEWTIE